MTERPADDELQAIEPIALDGEVSSVDGEIGDARDVEVPLLDDGLLRGDGAFEFLRCYAGRPFALGEHLDRLERTCGTIMLDCPRQTLEEEIAELLAYAGPVACDLRIVLTRGGRRILILEPSPPAKEGRFAFVEDTPRLVLHGAKTLSYAGNMLARREAEQRGFDEALLVRPDGLVMEVQQASFFWVTPGGELCTPPLGDGILDSITRRVVLRRLEVTERSCTRQDALEAAEAFAAGTSREVQPIRAIAERVFQACPGPVTERAIEAFRDHVTAELGLTRAQAWPDFDR